MKVKEIINFECWDKWSGLIWRDTYAENIFEIKESDLPKTADEYPWDWYEIPEDWFEESEESLEDKKEYIKIVVEFYKEDEEPYWDEPFIRISKREIDIYKERYL